MNSEERKKYKGSPWTKNEDIALITASRLVIKNGVGDVIKALPKLSENIKFVILGEGELKQKLIKLAKDLGVSDRVIFKGFVSHEKYQNI